MIEEKHERIRFVAAADVTDDCLVEVQLRKRRQTMTPEQAFLLAVELTRSAMHATKAADELRHEHGPAAFDLIEVVYCGDAGSAGYCTRPSGHTGVHYAQTSENAVPYAAWAGAA